MSQPTESSRSQVIANRLIQYRIFKHEYDLAIAREDGDRTREYNLLVQIAALFAQEQVYERAIQGFQQALRLARRMDNRQMEGSLLCTVADLYNVSGQRGLAIRHYEAALRLADDTDDAELRATCQEGLRRARAAVLLKHLEEVRSRPALPVEAPPPFERPIRTRPPVRNPQPLWLGLVLFFSIFLVLPVTLTGAGVADNVTVITVLAASLTGLYWYRNVSG